MCLVMCCCQHNTDMYQNENSGCCLNNGVILQRSSLSLCPDPTEMRSTHAEALNISALDC